MRLLTRNQNIIFFIFLKNLFTWDEIIFHNLVFVIRDKDKIEDFFNSCKKYFIAMIKSETQGGS